MNFTRPHHITIQKLLNVLNSEYLQEHNILFGGGTRISLELNEYRESVDVDFLCSNTASYRAVRNQVTQISFGDLINEKITLAKDIKIDRDAVRASVKVEDTIIKMEFVNMYDYQLTADPHKPFGVPMIDRDSCFLTKVLAHSDRLYSPNNKDLYDLLMMSKAWGMPNKSVWKDCERIYGKAPKRDLINRIEQLNNDDRRMLKVADSGVKMGIDKTLIQSLLFKESKILLNNLTNEPKPNKAPEPSF